MTKPTKMIYCKYCQAMEDAEIHNATHHINKNLGVKYGKECHVYKRKKVYV